MKSRGYRKVAGDICTKGSGSPDFESYEFTCCVNSKIKTVVIGLSAALGGTLLILLTMVLAFLAW